MKLTKADLERLTQDLVDACAEAERVAYREKALGYKGMANLDTLQAKLRATEDITAAFMRAQCELSQSTYRGGWRFVHIPVSYGEGLSRTRAVEAALRVLRDRGWEDYFSVWYFSV